MTSFEQYRSYDFDLTGLADSKVNQLEKEFDKITKKLGIAWRNEYDEF